MENSDIDWGALEADVAADASEAVAETLSALAAFDTVPQAPLGRVHTQHEQEADDLYRMTQRFQRVPTELIEANLDRIHLVNDAVFTLFEARGWQFGHGLPPQVGEAINIITTFLAFLDEHGDSLPAPVD